MDTINEPAIIPLTDEPETQNYLNRLSTAIAERPEDFAALLETLGEAATKRTLDLRSDERRTVPIAVTDEDLIVGFFKHRFDMESEYDDDTEKAMKTDKQYTELLDQHLNTHSINSQLGPMKHEVVANPNADTARNAARRARLAFFISRAIAYQQQTRPERLPSAG